MAIQPTGFKTDAEGAYIVKDPQARKDYTVDWSRWLNAGDIIAAVQWTVEPGLNKHNEGKTDTTTFIELSGGEAGKAYVCVAHITTANGLEDEKSFRVVIRNNI